MFVRRSAWLGSRPFALCLEGPPPARRTDPAPLARLGVRDKMFVELMASQQRLPAVAAMLADGRFEFGGGGG